MKRTNIVKLEVDELTHQKLIRLAVATARCWNDLNLLRLHSFRWGEKVDLGLTAKAVYEKYKYDLRSNVMAVISRNNAAWKGFFALLEAKKEGRLPKNIVPRPPGLWIDKYGRYKLAVFIKSINYEIYEDEHIIYLKSFRLPLRFKGKLKWHGKKSKLEIFYDRVTKSWYAYITVDVPDVEKTEKGLRASVDLGIINLATVYIEDGTWLLFKGGSVLSQYMFYSKQISRTQKLLARHKQRASRRLRLLYIKRKRFLRHALNSMVRRIMVELKNRGVTEVVIGYPKAIARHVTNKLVTDFWKYGYIISRFKIVGEELGINVVEVNEAYTSKTCSLCGEIHGGGRIRRGLYKCPRTGRVINADLNGAINILHIPESQGATDGGLTVARDRGNGLKAQPVVYRWTNGAGWVATPTSNEVVRMKAVNHKPMNASGRQPSPSQRRRGGLRGEMTSHAYMRFEVITENYLNARSTHVLMEPTTELKIPFDGHPISVKVYMVNENYRRILIVNSKKEGIPHCRLLFTGTADYKGEIVLLDEYGAPVAVLHNKNEVLDAIETIVKPYISHNTRELFVWIM